MPEDHDRLFSLPQVAERTATSTAFWRKLVAGQRIPVVRIGRCVRIRQADLDAWLRLGLRSGRREGRR